LKVTSKFYSGVTFPVESAGVYDLSALPVDRALRTETVKHY
jgi:hypothetical protein